MYLDAYMKREEEPKEATAAETKETVQAPQIDETEVENRGVRKALNAVSKLMLCCDLLRNQECCNKFSALSGLSGLESVMEFTTQNCRCNGENQNRWTASQELLFNFVARTPVATSSGKPLVDICDLVDSVVNSTHFDKFVPVEEKPVVVPEPVQQESARKQSEKIMTRSRKESEAQQDVFMAEDDSSEDEPAPAEKSRQNGVQESKIAESKTEEPKTTDAAKEPKAPRKQVEKAPAKRKGEHGGDLDSEDDEWITTTRGTKPYAGGERGGRGRGGRGRGGRGYYRGKDGERVERAERGPRKEGEEGERRWNKDGYKPRGDGERGGRDGERGGERGRGERGGRGRGGYRGKKPWTTGQDGERRNFTKGTNEGDKPQSGEGQAPLKEIGTLEQAPAKVEVQKEE